MTSIFVSVLKNYLYAILWASFILFATLSSGGTLTRFHLSELFAYDKPIHMFLFGMQAWLLIKARIKTAYTSFIRIVMFACISSFLFGVFTEILQGIFILFGRSFDYLDMIADGLGCLIVYAWFAWKKK